MLKLWRDRNNSIESTDQAKSKFNVAALAGSHERRLLNDLMNTYNKLERPVNTNTNKKQIQIQKTNTNTNTNTESKYKYKYKQRKQIQTQKSQIIKQDNPHEKVPNETQAIVLKFGLTLQQIMDVVSFKL